MKKENQYDIYKYDFHQAERTIVAEANDVDSAKNLKVAQTHFDSIFDKNTIDKLAKVNSRGEATILPNDVLAKQDGIYVWRVNNSQMKKLWLTDGSRDNLGKKKYEEQEMESNPYCIVIIDNRPGHGIMAIPKSPAWGGKPDLLRDVLRANFNSILVDQCGLEMRIEARMSVREIWDFMHERIDKHHDYVKQVAFTFQNPNRINLTDDTCTKNRVINQMINTLKAQKALEGAFSMMFGKDSEADFSRQNRDLAEMVRLCAGNGYDLSITFNHYKTYRINDYVRACYPLAYDYLQNFTTGQRTLDNSFDLAHWFDDIIEETKNYINESEAPKRRNRARK